MKPGPRRGRKYDPTADVHHPLYLTYRYHRKNKLCPWDSFAEFKAWAEKWGYNPANGDRISLRYDRQRGFAPRVKKRGQPDIFPSEPTSPEDSAAQRTEDALRVAWSEMHSKCSHKDDPAYHVVGAMGICVAAAWHTFDNFKDWALSDGSYAEGRVLMRYDRNRDFGPENSIFA